MAPLSAFCMVQVGSVSFPLESLRRRTTPNLSKLEAGNTADPGSGTVTSVVMGAPGTPERECRDESGSQPQLIYPAVTGLDLLGRCSSPARSSLPPSRLTHPATDCGRERRWTQRPDPGEDAPRPRNASTRISERARRRVSPVGRRRTGDLTDSGNNQTDPHPVSEN